MSCVWMDIHWTAFCNRYRVVRSRHLNRASSAIMAESNTLLLGRGTTLHPIEQHRGVAIVPAEIIKPNEDYKIYLAKTMGLAQIIIGTICFIQSLTVAILSYNGLWLFTSGWWAWPFFIISGSFGLASGSYPNSCMIISSMVMSIISCASAVVAIAQMAVGLSLECWSCQRTNDTETSLHAISYLSLVCWLFEFTVSLIQSIITCPAVCCTGKDIDPQDLRKEKQV